MADVGVSLLDGAFARRWAVAVRSALAARRADLDALNVFPVPDGDTGTNLYLTVDGALESLRGRSQTATAPDLPAETAALASAALLSARGNSGVILSQLLRGFSEVVAESGRAGLDGPALARALRRASDLARAGVTRPVEGTILTVADAAADAAERVATTDLYAVAQAALAAAREALDRTPGQLAVLARAGVVDAGAAGYVVVLESLERVLAGDHPVDEGWWRERRAPAPVPTGGGARADADIDADPGSDGDTGSDGDAPGRGEPGDAGDGPAYEVMYLLEDADDASVAALRDELDRLGDSLIVVGGPQVWNVHVHVDDVGAALEAGVRAGRPHRIAVTRFSDPSTGEREHPARATAGAAVAVLACAAGDGLADLFRSGGAQVVSSAPGRRASVGELLAAARRTDAARVLVLPADRDTELAAQAAARAAGDEGLRLEVVPARTVPQAVAAVAVFDPDRSAADNLAAMRAAAEATRAGGVAVADRDAMTGAGPCRAGDVLGLVGDDVVCLGTDPSDVATKVAGLLVRDGGELLTLVTGKEAPDGLAESVATAARGWRTELEITVVDGGLPAHLLLLGVE